jgi:hypothetical protein
MRSINFTDLVVVSSMMCLLMCSILVLQIIIITKATIPADQVIAEVRAFRSQVSAEHSETIVKVDDVLSFIDAHITTVELSK